MDNLDFQEKVDAIVAKYQPELDQIRSDGEQLQDETQDPGFGAVINVDFDVEWKDRKFAFDVPTVTMKQKDISFDLPRVTKKARNISFDIPEVVMETWCVMKVPKVSGFPPKVKMECVYADKPVVRMRTKKIVVDVPEMTMERRSFSTKIPEFGTRTIEFIVTIPEFTVKNVDAEIKKVEKEGEALQARAEKVAAQMESEIQSLVRNYFGGASDEETGIRREVENEFDTAIAELTNSINQLSAQNIDASKVPAEGGNINVRKMLADVIDEKTNTIKQVDQLIDEPVA